MTIPRSYYFQTMDTGTLERVLKTSPSDTIRTLIAAELRLRNKMPPWHDVHTGRQNELLEFIQQTERGHTTATKKKLRLGTSAAPQAAQKRAATKAAYRKRIRLLQNGGVQRPPGRPRKTANTA